MPKLLLNDSIDLSGTLSFVSIYKEFTFHITTLTGEDGFYQWLAATNDIGAKQLKGLLQFIQVIILRVMGQLLFLSRKIRGARHVFCNATQSTLLDKMVTKYWRKPHYYVDDIYRPYHHREEFVKTAVKPR